jgi:hypothetical protein
MILERIEQNVLAAIADQLAKTYKDTLELDFLQHQKYKETNKTILNQNKDEDGEGKDAAEERDVGDEPATQAKNDGESSDEEALGGNENDADENRLNRRHKDDAADYEGEEEEPEVVDEEEMEVSDSENEDGEELEDKETSKKVNLNDERDRITVSFLIY